MNQLLRSCFYTAMRTHGICPNCGHDGVLPGRLNHTDQRPVCLTCAGIPGAYCCRHCGVDGEMYRRRQTTAIVLSPREMRILLSAEPVPVPAPFAGMLNHHLHNRPNLRTGGGMVANPWLFPGHYPGTHLDPQSIMQRLRKPGVNLLQGRNSALQNLVAEVPPPLVAETARLQLRSRPATRRTRRTTMVAMRHVAVAARGPPASLHRPIGCLSDGVGAWCGPEPGSDCRELVACEVV